jgi:hypothetical protein
VPFRLFAPGPFMLVMLSLVSVFMVFPLGSGTKKRQRRRRDFTV